MNMDLKTFGNRQLGGWCFFPVVTSFILNVISIFFEPGSSAVAFVYQLATVLLMISFACTGVKLHIDGWHIPAAGFTLLAISQGIFFSSIHIDGSMDYSGVSGVYFLITAVVMTLYCGLFPLWLRLFGLLSAIPFAYLMYLIYRGQYAANTVLENVIFFIFMLTVLGWSWYVWRDERRKNLENAK